MKIVFEPGDKVRVTSGSHKDEIGEVKCVYPEGLVAAHEVVHVTFSLSSSGQFRPYELTLVTGF